MSTGNTFANITSKKILGHSDLDARVLQYLRELVRESHNKVWDAPTIHDTALALSADGANAFKITGSSVASDGQGRLLVISDSSANSGLSFENTNLIPYFVALKYATIPVEIDVNPRTGLPEYRHWQEEIGEEGTPNDVIDNGNSTITFHVDSITEAGVSNAGRRVLVYKIVADKNASTAVVAIETRTVAWNGVNNTITTSGSLGQSAISTIESEYKVIMLGPTVKRYVDLTNVDGYAYIGTITGNGGTPTAFDHSLQQLSTVTLSQLNQIGARAPNDRLKIRVVPLPAEEGIDQIASCNSDGNEQFAIDERGISRFSSFPAIHVQSNIWKNPIIGSGEGKIYYASIPGTANIKASACCVVNGKRKTIFIDQLTNIAYKFDVETMAFESSHNITANLNASYTWFAICAFGEGTTMYVYFNNTAGRTTIQAIDISSWTVKIGWPTAGYEHTGLQSHPASAFGRMLINMHADYMIYLTGNRDGRFYALSKADGTLFSGTQIPNSQGNYSALGSANYEPMGTAFDGKYLYTVAMYNASGNGYLHSIDTTPWPGGVSNTGCPGAGHPPTIGSVATDNRRCCIAAVNNRVALAKQVPSGVGSGIYVCSPNMAAKLADAVFSTNYYGPWDMIGIGNHIWMKITVHFGSGSTPTPALFKLDPHKIIPATGPATRTITNLETYGDVFLLEENEISSPISGTNYNENTMSFDGSDIWTVGSSQAETANRYFYRFHNALYR